MAYNYLSGTKKETIGNPCLFLYRLQNRIADILFSFQANYSLIRIVIVL
jgi:hypothetical protein